MPRPISEADEIAQLKQKRDELAALVEAIDRQLSEKALVMESESLTQSPETTSSTSRRSVRDLVLDALEDIGYPTYTRVLAQYAKAKFGRDIAATRFGTLAADEPRAFQRSSGKTRPVWLGFALTHDRFEPIKRLMVRSDWPLETRIHGPRSGRVLHLQLTKSLCNLAINHEHDANDPTMLKIIAADHARDLPGITFRRGEFDLESWHDTAHALLEQLLPADLEIRSESAALLAKRPEMHQLFGSPEIVEGLDDRSVRSRRA